MPVYCDFINIPTCTLKKYSISLKCTHYRLYAATSARAL